jgi:hypothetical protein
MHFSVWQPIRTLMAGVLMVFFAFPSNLAAQAHVVSPADLQKETRAASQTRERNLQTLTQFLSSERAQKALRSAHMDPTQVKTAVSTLNDQELAQLASRSAKAQADFAAGRIEDRDLLLILVAVAALILIIVAVR